MYRLYTHNDLDGVGCGILARLAFGTDVDVRYNSVQGLDFQIERFLEQNRIDDVLLITDLSVHSENEKKIEEFVKKGGSVTMLDHHKTALHFNDYSWASVTVQYDDGRLAAATSLLYDYLRKQGLLEASSSLDDFVELVRLWDTWEWEKHEVIKAKRLNDLFFMLSIDEFEERMVKRLQENESFEFDEFEEKILDMEETKIERYIRRKRRELIQTFIGPYCTGIVHAESYHSELGNELGKDCPHLDYIAILNAGGKKISFRTIHDHVDVSEVANQFGGGGHAKASGCSLTEEAFKLYISEPFPLEPLRVDAFRNQHNLKAGKSGSLYIDHADHRFFIYPINEDRWMLEKNQSEEDFFSSFEEAENYIKRNYLAWLARDDLFVRYLADHVLDNKRQNAKQT
ncbi:oligoribonuclease [Alkalihalobacillus sp. MEB130]|uniref:DHH family phosphoesterase n=1 Tax=Alkalihalobacillus sp. MEB130 TaxID=2976704 RepID=UPI0028DF2030|nr:oligoribonuclease [Alkalihalobacillus sp. MEB130]MDT8862445.1 oligoribonuclease [Alkalihalobacillus sp. MEB130]